MTRKGTELSELPDDVETLKKLLIQKNSIIADNAASISGKDTVIAELEKRNELLAEQVGLFAVAAVTLAFWGMTHPPADATGSSL